MVRRLVKLGGRSRPQSRRSCSQRQGAGEAHAVSQAGRQAQAPWMQGGSAQRNSRLKGSCRRLRYGRWGAGGDGAVGGNSGDAVRWEKECSKEAPARGCIRFGRAQGTGTEGAKCFERHARQQVQEEGARGAEVTNAPRRRSFSAQRGQAATRPKTRESGAALAVLAAL